MPKTPRLREWRERAALSQMELAERSGTSRATIADLEAGNRAGQPKTVRRLAEALGIEPGELYAGEYPKDEAPSWLELSFNDVIEERRLSRFADGIAAAADKWIEAVSRPQAPDAVVAGILEAAMDLYQLIGGRITRSEWETLTSQEQGELVAVMDKLANVGAEASLRLVDSGYFDAERARIHREKMREWTDRISA